MSQIPSNNQEIVSVSDVNNLAKGLLEKDLSNVWIQGEISSFTAHGSGHWYFTIKDKKSSLSCVMFKFENQNVLFDPKVGDELILNGNISIYAPSGRYQFNVKHIEVFGEGALLKAFEDLKFKLESEGLFSQNIKKEIPSLPLSVAVITSETGAVFKDIINVLRRRSPFIKLTLIESKVQGKTADKDIAQAIKRANEVNDFELIILARGGGSIEDLWCFNMESVARAISNSQLPIISAVGHETDFTISDFVADLRAPTPSAAAEIISQNHSNLLESFSRNKTLIENRFLNLISQLKEELDLKIALLRHPGEKLRETSQKIDNFETRMKGTLINNSLEKKNTLEANIALLKRSSPITRIKSSQNRIKVGSMKLINSISKNIETKKKTTFKILIL
jgi:exodeoxyribonuclease VII large subunit